MAGSFLNLGNNLAEEIHKIKHDDKKCKTRGIKCKYCDCFLKYTNFKYDLTEYECLHVFFLRNTFFKADSMFLKISSIRV